MKRIFVLFLILSIFTNVALAQDYVPWYQKILNILFGPRPARYPPARGLQAPTPDAYRPPLVPTEPIPTPPPPAPLSPPSLSPIPAGSTAIPQSQIEAMNVIHNMMTRYGQFPDENGQIQILNTLSDPTFGFEHVANCPGSTLAEEAKESIKLALEAGYIDETQSFVEAIIRGEENCHLALNNLIKAREIIKKPELLPVEASEQIDNVAPTEVFPTPPSRELLPILVIPTRRPSARELLRRELGGAPQGYSIVNRSRLNPDRFGPSRFDLLREYFSTGRKASSADPHLFLAQATTGINRDKLMASKSSYQDKYYKTLDKVSETVDKILPALVYSGSDSVFRNEVNYAHENLKACLTDALQKKVGAAMLEEELDVFAYVLWFFDDATAAIERMGKSTALTDDKKAEGIIGVIRGCQKLANATFKSVTDYKDQVVDIMNKDILVSAPAKPTKLNLDSVKVTVFADSTRTGYSNPGKSNYCNTFNNQTTTGKAWENLSKAGAADGDYASVTLAAGESSDQFRVSTCNITLSSNTKEISGIQVDVARYVDTSVKDTIKDLEIRLVRNNGLAGIDHASSTATTTNYITAYYGGEQDAWGEKWTTTDIKNIGVSLAFKNHGYIPPEVKTAEVVQATTQTTTAAAPAQTNQPTPAVKEHPITALLREIKTGGTIKPNSEGKHVEALQKTLVMLAIGKPGQDLKKAVDGGTKLGKAGGLTVSAYDVLNQFLAYWANNNKMTDDEDFRVVIKGNKDKEKTFGLPNVNALIKYIQKSQKK